MNIVEHDWNWARPLTRRVGLPAYVDWHHAAAKQLTPAALHLIHLGLGWCGFAYNFYIRKDGSIHRGRPLAFCGGGALGHWSDVGVCLEGNYDVEKEMPAAQLRSAQEVHDYLARKYPGIKHRRHRDVPDNATACPGQHFDYKSIMAGVPPAPKRIALTDRQKTIPRPLGVRAGWRNLGFKVYLKRVRAQGDGDRIIVTATHITFPIPSKRPWWWAKMLEWKRAQVVPAEPEPTPTVRKRPPLFWERLLRRFKK